MEKFGFKVLIKFDKCVRNSHIWLKKFCVFDVRVSKWVLCDYAPKIFVHVLVIIDIVRF